LCETVCKKGFGMTESTHHASAVLVGESGVLVLGASGSGKSTLCLQLMSLGAHLIADDKTVLTVFGDEIWAKPPEKIAGLIEFRGVGVLTAAYTGAVIKLVIDLDQCEVKRLPELHNTVILGQTLPCLYRVENPAWPAAIMQILKHSRKNPT
jgi:serine kinase of HPr protein (carbohydrate metabolism regulator)